ncbi:hypothetical protein [Bradyrhizobium sp.]|uniref:hypothetical protein n=1 Tax=Bradyrhizobium sp. TaxID=376 RepID=UPI00345BE804
MVVANTEGELHDGAVKAYRAYRAKGYHSVWRIDGKLTPLGPRTFETPAGAKARFAAQEKLWNFVWLRRIAYL